MDPLTTTASSGIEGLVALCTDTWTLLFCGAIYLGLRSLDGMLRGSIVWRRVLPFMPEVMSFVLAVCGFVPSCAEEPIAVRIAVAIWMAYVAKNFRKFLGQTILGDDARITELAYGGRRRPSGPPAPPAEGGSS